MQGGRQVNRILALLLCATLLLTGCTIGKTPYVPTGNGLNQPSATQPTQPPSVAEQEMSLGYDPQDSFNPYLATTLANRTIFGLLYQSLFAVDEDYQVWPILCSRYTVSKDMRTYVFFVENATFSDGSSLTAEDVAASLLAAKESTVYQGRFTQVRQIRVAENGGVEITLNTPYENLPILLDVPIVKASQTAYAQPLGTGPYLLEEGMNGLRLLRRNNWWCKANVAVTASYIPLVAASTPAQFRDEFEMGDVGLVCTDPGSDSYVDFRCDYELWDCETGMFLYLACNETSAVFSNAAVRAALTHAIDRDTLVNGHYRGFALSTTLPASAESPYYDAALAGRFGYDAAAFAQAVTDAELTGSAVKLLVNAADGRRVRVAKDIAAMLEACGLNVTVSAVSGSSYQNALTKGNFDLHLGQTKLSANMDLSAFFDPAGSLNFGGLSDAALYALCQSSLANTGNYYTLYQRVMEDGILCPILTRSYAIYVERGLLDDLQPVRDNLFFYTLGKSMEDIA